MITTNKSLFDIQNELWDLLQSIGFFNIRDNAIDFQLRAKINIDSNHTMQFYFDIYFNPFTKDYVFSCEPENLELFHGFSTHYKIVDMKNIEHELYNNYKFLKPRQYNLFDFI